MTADIAETLKQHDIQPSVQRMAVAAFVLATDRHPSADHVWTEARRRLPVISRATVFNTLNLFVEKGLLKRLVLSEGNVVFDPRTDRHHHFIDEGSGRIHDVPWGALSVSRVRALEEFEVDDYQVVMRGRLKKPSRR